MSEHEFGYKAEMIDLDGEPRKLTYDFILFEYEENKHTSIESIRAKLISNLIETHTEEEIMYGLWGKGTELCEDNITVEQKYIRYLKRISMLKEWKET